MRLAANTTISTYVTDFARPDSLLHTSYSDNPISFYNWLVYENRRLEAHGLPTAIIEDIMTGEVALAYVHPDAAESPELRPELRP